MFDVWCSILDARWWIYDMLRWSLQRFFHLLMWRCCFPCVECFCVFWLFCAWLCSVIWWSCVSACTIVIWWSCVSACAVSCHHFLVAWLWSECFISKPGIMAARRGRWLHSLWGIAVRIWRERSCFLGEYNLHLGEFDFLWCGFCLSCDVFCDSSSEISLVNQGECQEWFNLQ